MMTMFARHFLVRLRMLATEPASLGLLLLAGASSVVIWPWLAVRSGIDIAGVDEFVAVMGLLLWPSMIGVVAVGRTAGGRGGISGPLASETALPALPIGPRSRILADTLAVLLAALLFRLPAMVLGPGAWDFVGAPAGIGDAAGFRRWFLLQTVGGALVFLPVLIAWCAPSRSHVFYLVRPVLVCVPLFAVVRHLSPAHPWPAAAACLVLAVVVLSTAHREPPSRRTGAVTSADPWRWCRAGIDPEMRLRRDRWTEPLRAGWPLLSAVAAAEVLVLLLESRYGTPVTVRALVAGTAVGLLLSYTVFRPFGLQLLRPAFSPSDSTSGGCTLLRAWSYLPARPEAVLRGVYLHALAGGSLLIVLTLIHLGAVRMLGFEEYSSMLLLAPLTASVPVLAGFSLAMAGGDRLRTGISLAVLIALLPAHITLFVQLGRAGMSPREPGPGMAIDLGVLAVLAAMGGLPPLALLRGRTGRRHV